jgi:hypothetical protein
MFQFNLATIPDRDIRDTISAMDLFLSAVHGQANNPAFLYLLEMMRAEAKRRQDNQPGAVVDVLLPLGDCTHAHVWALVKFAGGVVEGASKFNVITPALQFFARIIDQIEAATERIQAAALN